MIRVENHDGSHRDFASPPPDTPFRLRVRATRMRASWDLLNGRFVRRPLGHRLPPEPFVSKQRERRDEFLRWLRTLSGPRRPRRPPPRKAPTYWWGEFAKMRVPASRGLAALNREFHRMLREGEEDGR